MTTEAEQALEERDLGSSPWLDPIVCTDDECGGCAGIRPSFRSSRQDVHAGQLALTGGLNSENFPVSRAGWAKLLRAVWLIAIMSLRARECVRSPVCSRANSSLKQFEEMRKMMRQLGALAKGGRLPRMPGMPRER